MLACGLIFITALTVFSRFNDPDLWWHLKVGEIVWNTHSIPSTDTFSHTTFGHSWTAHEWLAQLSIYGAYKFGGYTGLMLWVTVFASLMSVLIYALCWLRSQNALIAFMGGLTAWFFSTIGLAIRPHILGYLFLTTELLVLELGRRRRRWLWVLPPLFAVWVNCHGSYFFGMGVMGVYWACAHITGKWGIAASEAWEKKTRNLLGLVLILSILALCVNPVGIRLLLYPLDTLFHQSTGMSTVQEWLPPDLWNLRTIGMIAAVVFVLIVSMARRSNLELCELVVCAAATGLALRHGRMLFLFGIVVSPMIGRILRSDRLSERKREHRLLNAVLMYFLLAMVVSAFPSVTAMQAQVAKTSPVHAVEFIRRAGLSGPMLNEYHLGGYLIWALPEQKVFIDGRADVFDWAGVLKEYGQWATLQDDPPTLLNKYHVRFCLLAKNAPMARVLPYLPGWRKAYSDDVSVIFSR